MKAANRSLRLLFQFRIDEFFHLWVVALDAEQQVQLVIGADEVVVGVLALPVLVAAKVVPEETDALHVGEESCGVGQVLYLDG